MEDSVPSCLCPVAVRSLCPSGGVSGRLVPAAPTKARPRVWNLSLVFGQGPQAPQTFAVGGDAGKSGQLNTVL